MSTGFYTRISNTVVSGSNLLADLDFDANALRALESKGCLSIGAPKVLAGGSVAGNALSANQWVDAMNYGQGLAPPGEVSSIQLGSDMASIAKQYQNLFNITSTNQVRIAKFVLSSATTSYTTISLANASGTSTYVQVKVDDGTSTTAASSKTLFNQSSAFPLTTVGTRAGAVRDVAISSGSLTSGSETIIFTVLGGSV